MADDRIADIIAITNCEPKIAAQYLQLADGDSNQAVTLYFENGGADLSGQSAHSTTAPRDSQTSRPTTYEDSNGVIHIDSGDEDEGGGVSVSGARSGAATDTFDSDLEMARRLQEEMYGAPGLQEEEDVRAPIARQAATLVGPGADMDFPTADEMPGLIRQQMQAIQQRRTAGRAGIFNQQAPSIWNSESGAAAPQQPSAAAAAASEASRKSNLLAELYRPPFELMYTQSWDEARDEGKDKKKWILVNIQDPSIFDCQLLNRDVWKNEGVVETINESFIFIQYSKDDPRATQYLQYYFQSYDNTDSYPHIAIVDPRTGEQVKSWTGPPTPKAADFLMQLHEFLDRYSLRSDARMPVAKRKPEIRKEKQVSQMTEEEQLEMALKASMQGHSPSRDEDPDDLTRSIPDLKGKGKAKATEVIDVDEEMDGNTDAREGEEASPVKAFDTISSTSPHTEPAQGPESTRISFRHPGGRVIRRFSLSDPVRRIYEWLKATPLDDKQGSEFDLIFLGKNLMESLNDTIESAGLKNGTVMVEYVNGE